MARRRRDPDSDFNHRFIGEISRDGRTIEARWERGIGDAGDPWELDFPITYVGE
jgi:hypothetical protein